jgi:enoyl-CoA hydratase/carnithine racemase
MKDAIPAGFQLKGGIMYGSRVPGLLEIKFHTPETRNAITNEGQRTIGELVNAAQKDDSVKVILLQGGKYYSSGNDLSALTGWQSMEPAEMRKAAEEGAKVNMQRALNAINQSIKPTIAVVRGGCLGIAFTMLTLVDFIYASPDAHFMVPFM